jgi:hypothetical protein
MSVMQLRKFFIANTGVNVLVIINANDVAMPIIVGNVIPCMTGTLNLFTIKQIQKTRHYQTISEYTGFKWVVCLHDFVHYEKVHYIFKESELYS